MFREFVARVSVFLMLLGIGVAILFVASIGTGEPNFDYLFWSLLVLIGSFILRGKRDSKSGSTRFGVLRRFRGKGRERSEDR